MTITTAVLVGLAFLALVGICLMYKENRRLNKAYLKALNDQTAAERHNREYMKPKIDKLKAASEANLVAVCHGKEVTAMLRWMYNPATSREQVGVFGDLYTEHGIQAALDYFKNGGDCSPAQKIVKGLDRLDRMDNEGTGTGTGHSQGTPVKSSLVCIHGHAEVC